MPLAAERGRRYRWALVAGFSVTQTVGYGVLYYSYGVLLVAMQHDLGWSRVSLTGAYSLAILVAGLASVWVGRLLDHRDPRLLLTFGSVVATVFVFAWSRVSTLFELYVVFFGIGVGMSLTLYEAAFVVVTKWFRSGRTAALATLTTLAAPSSIVFAPLSERLVADYGWRTAVRILALILASITVPIHALLVRRPPAHASVDSGLPVETTRGMATGRPSFWAIVIAFLLSSFTTIAITVHLVPMLVAGGRRPAAAALALGLLGLFQIPGRLVFVFLERFLGAGSRMGAVFALAAASLALLATTRSTWAMLVFVLCFGMSGGMLTLLRATLVADLYGRANYGAIAGVVSAFALAGRAAAPLGAAVIALAPGGYTTLLVSLAGITACAAVVGAGGAARSAGLRDALGGSAHADSRVEPHSGHCGA